MHVCGEVQVHHLEDILAVETCCSSFLGEFCVWCYCLVLGLIVPHRSVTTDAFTAQQELCEVLPSTLPHGGPTRWRTCPNFARYQEDELSKCTRCQCTYFVSTPEKMSRGCLTFLQTVCAVAELSLLECTHYCSNDSRKPGLGVKGGEGGTDVNDQMLAADRQPSSPRRAKNCRIASSILVKDTV